MRIPRLFLFLFAIALFAAELASAQGWLWGRGSTGAEIDAWCVAADHSGNVFVGGGYSSGVEFNNYKVPFLGHGAQSLVAKYDAAGNFLWANGTRSGDSWPINITTDKDGNVFLFGFFFADSTGASLQIGSFSLVNPSPVHSQYFLAKFDPSGNVLWALNAGNTQSNYNVLIGYAYVLAIGGVATDASGNCYVTANYHLPSITIGGNTLVNSDPSGNTDDILLVKYDPLGNVIWAKTAGGPNSDDAYAITVTPAGDVYIAGVFGSPLLTFGSSVIANTSPNQVTFVARYNSGGTALWGSSDGGSGGAYACALASDANSNVYMTGGIKETSISFSGTTIANPFVPRPALYLVKFDPSNNVDWYKTIGWPPVLTPTDSGDVYIGGGFAWGYSVATSVCGDVWVTGAMSDTVGVDGHILTADKSTNDPVVIAGFTSAGSYISGTTLASGADDQNGIACDNSGNVFTCSDYAYNSFVIGVDRLPNPAGEWLYVGKYAAPKTNSATGSSETFCLNSPRQVTISGGYSNYTWNDGYKGNARLLKDTGTYLVYGEDKCRSSSFDTFKVIPACDCSKSLFVPNAFTPNSDGQDDIFYPRTGPGIDKIKTFRIYNRWGELLFGRENIMANDASNAWDGTFKGEKPLPDVYVWVVEAICENGDVINKKGSVTVIR